MKNKDDVKNKLLAISEDDINKYPDIELFNTNLEKGLWVLYVVSSIYDEINSLSPTEISFFLEEKMLIEISSKSISNAFRKAPKNHLKNVSRGKYKIMKKGIKIISNKNQPIDNYDVTVIEPNTDYSSKKKLKYILAEMSGTIRICDPYISTKTLDYIYNINKNYQIYILTNKVQDRSTGLFERTLSDLKKEGYTIIIKINSKLHDRYILDDDMFLYSGHSIKDLGSKHSFIVIIKSKEIRNSISKTYDYLWEKSKEF